MEPLERKAEQKWAEAESAYQARNFAKADAALQDLSQEPLAGTRKAAEVRPKVQEMHAAIVKLSHDQREDEAEKLYASARKNAEKLKWDDAQEDVQKLMGEYKDTEVVAKRVKEIAKMGDKIEAELQKTAATMIDDFEDGIKGWTPIADGDKGKIEESKEAQYGDKGARISFLSPKSKWSFLEKKLAQKPPDKTTGLSVWVKAVERPAKIRIQIRQGRDAEQVVWGKELVVGTEWTLVRVALTEMRHIWSPAADKKLPPPKFDLSKVQTVEVSQIDPRNTFTILIDHLKWDTRR
jgi:hypothetical protein